MKQTRYGQIRAVSLWGGLKNILLAAFKITFGITGHSHSLLADGLHSLSDLVLDGVVVIAAKFGSKAADDDHPYGHGRIETAATVLLACVLAIAAFAIIIDAGFTLAATHAKPMPSQYVLWIAITSIIVNEYLYFWTKRIAQKIKSTLLMTNAWHHRSDSASSLAVACGVTGAYLGFLKLDALAAVVVGCMVLHMAWNFGWHGLRELVDTVTNIEDTEKFKAFIIKIPGVEAIHQLRTRSIAGAIFCDVHVLVDSKLSVSEGHHIGQEVESCLTKKFQDVTDVTVHIDTEDNETNNPSYALPHRATLLPILEQAWQEWIPKTVINTTTIHYRNNKMTLELKLPLRFVKQTSLIHQLKKIMHSEKSIADIKLFYYETDE